MTTGVGPYVVPEISSAAGVLEATIIAAHTMVDLGGGLMAHAETFNGTIPGPTLLLNVGDTVIVRLVNELDHPTGIHWHGIELANSADGTEVTQEGVLPAFPVAPAFPAPAGGTYLYKFKVTRPGLYWYHPHHHLSLNRVFRGLYGMIIVTDPDETSLVGNALPSAADTVPLVLSDITVCKAAPNDAATYVDPMSLPAADRAEWLSGATAQLGPTPVILCEIPPTGTATADDGTAAAASYGADEIPSLVRTGRVTEGQTVLTNGVNVGERAGTPAAPGALAAGAETLDVLSGQGLRLQIVNCATLRYFRLFLTRANGMAVQLVRVGGEGGVLDNAIVEGGSNVGPGNFDTKYTFGEILLPPASRADVVAVIPAGEAVNSVLTLWTRDFPRTGPTNPGSWAMLPTVPVMHLKITGNAPGVPYAIGPGTALRASIPVPGAAVETLVGPFEGLLDPATFAMAPPGNPSSDIEITTPPGINGVSGTFEGFTPYTSAPHIASSRYAEEGRTLELTVTNTSAAHHPFHLHGFSFQPISLAPRPGAPAGTPTGTFSWPYPEFRDNIDLPNNYRLTFRVRLDDRELVDGLTLGGSLGRWLFHCHIFFHHHQGMISELVVTDADGNEKPNVDVAGSWAYTPLGGTAERHGTFSHPAGDLMTLTASKGTVVPTGPVVGGPWSWSLTSLPADGPSIDYVYITATDSVGLKDQAVFRLKIGAPDDGADNGDPHVHTVDGKRYDFQAVGEFTLLRDRDGMEIQVRQWPVETATPITDAYSGLTSCVSVNTAVAARVGSRRIAYQPAPTGSPFQLYLDGKPAELPLEGIDLDAHRVTAYAIAGGGTALRVDYAHNAVLTITPYFWSSYNIWLLNVSVSHTQGDEGIMGSIAENSWLPTLPNGATVGPMPDSLHDRYVALYKTFANAWRVTDKTSLFVYGPGTSTKTFTDEDWPAEKPPCKLKPQFVVPGANPRTQSISVDRAEKICQAVTLKGLHADCVFDVATTGDEDFAKVYLAEQDLRLRGSAAQIVGDKPSTRRGEPLVITATVMPLRYERATPQGTVTFMVDGVAAGRPVKLDERGRAHITTDRLDSGVHQIRAAYSGGGQDSFYPSTSPNLLHTVAPRVRCATLRCILRFFTCWRPAKR